MKLVSVFKLAALLTVVGASAATAQTQVAVEIRLGAHARPYGYDAWRYDRYDRWDRGFRYAPVTRCFTRGRWVRCRTVDVVVPRHQANRHFRTDRYRNDRSWNHRGR